jgi:hypothetical protein
MPNLLYFSCILLTALNQTFSQVLPKLLPSDLDQGLQSEHLQPQLCNLRLQSVGLLPRNAIFVFHCFLCWVFQPRNIVLQRLDPLGNDTGAAYPSLLHRFLHGHEATLDRHRKPVPKGGSCLGSRRNTDQGVRFRHPFADGGLVNPKPLPNLAASGVARKNFVHRRLSLGLRNPQTPANTFFIHFTFVFHKNNCLHRFQVYSYSRSRHDFRNALHFAE